jgi:signal transduction histidine kinase
MSMQIVILIFLVIAFFYFLRREINSNLTEKSFISIVNHTFRTPLTRIKWMSDSLDADQSREEKAEVARNISTSVNRLLEIIDTLTGIQDIHSSSSYDLKAVSLREIIEEAIGKYRAPLNEKKIALQIPTLVNMPLLTLDTKKITFVINVILENAIFYSNENGTVRIVSEMKDNKLTIAIEDNGIGLTKKDRRNLFKRFYRGDEAKKLNTDGMGVGLYVSNEIIRRHHGKLSAISKGVGRGSVFFITLPIAS